MSSQSIETEPKNHYDIHENDQLDIYRVNDINTFSLDDLIRFDGNVYWLYTSSEFIPTLPKFNKLQSLFENIQKDKTSLLNDSRFNIFNKQTTWYTIHKTEIKWYSDKEEIARANVWPVCSVSRKSKQDKFMLYDIKDKTFYIATTNYYSLLWSWNNRYYHELHDSLTKDKLLLKISQFKQIAQNSKIPKLQKNLLFSDKIFESSFDAAIFQAQIFTIFMSIQTNAESFYWTIDDNDNDSPIQCYIIDNIQIKK